MGTMQPVLGPDEKKREPESNVLLASIGNIQYAVTIDVLHTVFSAFGTVQKIAMFEKNGEMQVLIQYPNVAIASVAKESLEGHCIYDGGYCKLHMSYSRHTNLTVKAQNDRSRDYTIPNSALPPMQQPLHVPPGGWQNPQVTSVHAGNEYFAGAHIQDPDGQTLSWDPRMQVTRPNFVSAAGIIPGQAYGPPPDPSYSRNGTHLGSVPAHQGHHQ